MAKRDDEKLVLHHLTAAHLRDALEEPLAQKHLTSAHLQEALQPTNQAQPQAQPASSQQQQTGSAPAGGSGQCDNK